MIIKSPYVNNLVATFLALSINGFILGSCNTWSSPVVPKLQTLTSDNPFGRILTTSEIGSITSYLFFGSCVGCWIFGFLTHTIGRRYSAVILLFPIIISYLIMIFFKSVTVFSVARFIMGLTVGGIPIVQMILGSEISSKSNRGMLATCVVFAGVVGILFNYIVGPFVSVNTFNGILIVFPFISLILTIIFCEESPYFHAIKGRDSLVEKALLIYNRDEGTNIDEQLKEIKETIKEQQAGNILELIKTKAVIKSFLMGNMVIAFQQLVGINGVFAYSQTIFEKTGSNLSTVVSSIILSSIQTASSAIIPIVAERFNRRFLLIVSASGIFIFESILGAYCILDEAGKVPVFLNFLPVVTLAGSIISFNLGMGSITWAFVGEIYPTRIKSLSISFSVFTYSILGFLITRYLNTVFDAIGVGAVFLIFSGCCLFCILFVLFFVIETRGKTLEEIQSALKS